MWVDCWLEVDGMVMEGGVRVRRNNEKEGYDGTHVKVHCGGL